MEKCEGRLGKRAGRGPAGPWRPWPRAGWDGEPLRTVVPVAVVESKRCDRLEKKRWCGGGEQMEGQRGLEKSRLRACTRGLLTNSCGPQTGAPGTQRVPGSPAPCQRSPGLPNTLGSHGFSSRASYTLRLPGDQAICEQIDVSPR